MSQPTHILLVEDESHLAFGIQYNLEAEGFVVTTVGDGPSALAVMEQDDPGIDLIILDLMLPGMSGYDVCKKLRQSEQTLPVLMLSARSLPEDRARGFDVGADQYLNKPFELDELMSRVKSLLSRFGQRQKPKPASPESATATLNGRVVDLGTYEVTGAETARLTALEMKLLKYFLANPDRIVPKTELLENVWDLPGNVTTRAPDQFIRRLRKIFEENPGEPRLFITVRDAGYRFVSGNQPPAA